LSELLKHALRGAQHHAAAPLQRLQTALVVGAGGALGSALLAEALVAGRFQRVAAIVAGALTPALRGLDTVGLAALQGPAKPLGADVAFIVFERARHSNGRDAAFFQPEPAALPALATALHARGVKRLLVVVPHAPALLPQALKAGLASRAEGEVAALGFTHLVLLRTAQNAAPAAGGAALPRFAAWWLSQLSWMVPQREQPLRAAALAAVVVQIATALHQAAPGTRVLAPEQLWQLAQADGGAALAAWLATP
jgi:hypothetical protein